MSDPDRKQNLVRPDRSARFVKGILETCGRDKGFAARLRRADNPATEYQSWDVLAAYGIDLEKEHQRLPHVTVAATLARSRAESNGSLPLGRAVAACYDEGNSSDQARAKMRRLLACDDLREVCRILRPLLTLIQSRIAAPLDYIRLLRQLKKFSWNRESIKAQWAQEFYAKSRAGDEEAA
jgi:CRISPR system Cascade subunit CasB